MRFRDFDIVITPGYLPDSETRAANGRSRAFVEAIRWALGERKTEAPWGKLYVSMIPDARATLGWLSAIPTVGISSAGASMLLPDPALLTTEGEAIRPLLAAAVGSIRPLVQQWEDWDEPWFWDLIARTGAHRGRYEGRFLPATDRRAHVVHHLTYEWDEAGTTVYLDTRRTIDDAEVLARTVVGEYPGEHDLVYAADFTPRRLRIEGDTVRIYHRAGHVLAELPRPIPILA
jgi:hypothetical protein